MGTGLLAAALTVYLMTVTLRAVSRRAWRAELSRDRAFVAVLLGALLPWVVVMVAADRLPGSLVARPAVEAVLLITPTLASSLVFWRFLRVRYSWGLGFAVLAYILLIMCKFGLDLVWRLL